MKFESIVTTATALAATAVFALPGAAQAAQPGDLCRVAGGTGGGPVFTPVGVLDYMIPEGGYFRIEAYGPSLNGTPSYTGHGTSRNTGNMWRWVINQASCQP